MIACILREGDREVEVERGGDAWRVSCEWARFHGIDPNEVPAGTVVERDPVGRRILYESFVKTGPNLGDILIENGEPVIVARIEQGEAPPLPFPREAWS